MEGCLCNLVTCNLADSRELDELKEETVAEKPLATRTDQDSRTALHWACSIRHREMGILAATEVPVNDRHGAGWSLHIAASAGQDEIVKALLGKGAQVNAVSQNGCTPLHSTGSQNSHKVTVMFLEGRAQPHAKGHYEATANAMGSSQGQPEDVQSIHKHPRH
ncbi:26S proteasome non-ATPase regulatory subunit 10 [Sturnira hondurensis]|uniref:26S proteasome non-ATPase regulatory subunit 10 n=1 Tax=Sturnira hondurensis TaxID=192404 RepID=UPI0018794177|nr:26S proteasome non-ATPase regulatory subunit 10 [Sturnira hondurensis]